MEYRLIKSNRKSVAIEITQNCEVVVRTPKNTSQAFVESFVKSHEKWIEQKLEVMQKRLENKKVYTKEQETALRKAAEQYLPARVEHFASIMGVRPSGVKITSAKKRFGSCSGKNSLCFSLFLMDYDEKAIDYVTVHELAHIKHHNHSSAFWREVEKIMPDYKERQRLLF